MPKLKPIAYINEIQTVAMPFRVPQSEGIAWIMKALQHSQEGEVAARALNLYERLLSNKSIGFRGSVLVDYTHDAWEQMSLFKPFSRADKSQTPWSAPPLEQRMKVFIQAAQSMAREAFTAQERAPRYIIDISCTGYRAPFPAQELVLERGWENQTRLLKLGHMGCYASVPGIHLAAQLAQSVENEDIISVLSTELCTLHLDPLACDPDQVVSNILFADGCARMDVGKTAKVNSLALLAHYEALVPESAQFMSWDLQDSRFHMTLSRKVVTKLNKVIGQHVADFLNAHQLSLESIAWFAVHPGGPRIIESIQEELELSDKSVRHSKEVLYEHGNMSSATLPHVWKAMQDDEKVRSGDLIVSMAFGPGLTLTMNVLQKG